MKSGNKYNDDAAFTQYITDGIAGITEFTGTLAMRVRRGQPA